MIECEYEKRKCGNCFYYRRMKHNFNIGKGYEKSFCCIRYANDIGGFILEIEENSVCEEHIFVGRKENE